MKRAPNLLTIADVLDAVRTGPQSNAPGSPMWYAARPIGFDTIPHRLKCAWLVFTGRADALTWYSEPPAGGDEG